MVDWVSGLASSLQNCARWFDSNIDLYLTQAKGL